MKYRVKQAFIILDENGDVVDWRDTREEADAVVKDIEQYDQDKQSIDEAFEAAEN